LTRALHFIVPGAIDQTTGGYLYDAKIIAGMRDQGGTVILHELEGDFPGPEPVGRSALQDALAQVKAGEVAVVDGLAGGGYPDVLSAISPGVCLLILMHHPLHLETGLTAGRANALAELEARALTCAHGIITSSAFSARKLESWLKSKLHIKTCIPGTARFSESTGPGLGEPPRLLCLGSRIPRKGQDLLVQALAQLQHLDWTAVVAGSPDRDPEYAAHLDRLIAILGLEDRVERWGDCSAEDLEALFQRASLFVLPSWYEGYGMVLTEAMGHGLPVVTTTGGAIPDTVPADAGWLVAPGDLHALQHALQHALTHPEDCARKGRAGLVHAGQLPDWPDASRCFAQAVDQLCGSREIS
jgi:glycosyltransferase involved in cell wall biosynthesis